MGTRQTNPLQPSLLCWNTCISPSSLTLTHTHTHTHTHTQVSKFSTTILSAMLAGMDDREDPEDLITMEAMSGLARIFEQIDEGHVRPILINIALRIRPCFEKVALSDHTALRM